MKTRQVILIKPNYATQPVHIAVLQFLAERGIVAISSAFITLTENDVRRLYSHIENNSIMQHNIDYMVNKVMLAIEIEFDSQGVAEYCSNLKRVLRSMLLLFTKSNQTGHEYDTCHMSVTESEYTKDSLIIEIAKSRALLSRLLCGNESDFAVKVFNSTGGLRQHANNELAVLKGIRLTRQSIAETFGV